MTFTLSLTANLVYLHEYDLLSFTWNIGSSFKFYKKLVIDTSLLLFSQDFVVAGCSTVLQWHRFLSLNLHQVQFETLLFSQLFSIYLFTQCHQTLTMNMLNTYWMQFSQNSLFLFPWEKFSLIRRTKAPLLNWKCEYCWKKFRQKHWTKLSSFPIQIHSNCCYPVFWKWKFLFVLITYCSALWLSSQIFKIHLHRRYADECKLLLEYDKVSWSKSASHWERMIPFTLIKLIWTPVFDVCQQLWWFVASGS